MVDRKKEVLDRELDKNTKVLLSSINKIHRTIVNDKGISFQKQMGIKQLIKIYEPILNEYLKDETEEYKKEMKLSFEGKTKTILKEVTVGNYELYSKFNTHLIEVLTTRKTTNEKLEEIWK